MLLPFAAGGGGDVIGRLLADKMGKRLGQTIFVENRTGAAGTIGTQKVATSPADGYTIMIGGMTTHVLAPASYTSLPYDPIKDFASSAASERRRSWWWPRRIFPRTTCAA